MATPIDGRANTFFFDFKENNPETKPCSAIRLKKHFMWLVEEGIE